MGLMTRAMILGVLAGGALATTTSVLGGAITLDGRLDEASTSALLIVALGIIPVVLLSRAMDQPGAH